MPIVRINLFEGRTIERKRLLIKKVTAAVADALDIEKQGVRVILEDICKENYGKGGVMTLLNEDRGIG